MLQFFLSTPWILTAVATAAVYGEMLFFKLHVECYNWSDVKGTPGFSRTVNILSVDSKLSFLFNVYCVY